MSSTADDERSSCLPGRPTVVAFLAFAALTAEAGDVETREEEDRWRFYASEARRSTRLDSRKLNSLKLLLRAQIYLATSKFRRIPRDRRNILRGSGKCEEINLVFISEN